MGRPGNTLYTFSPTFSWDIFSADGRIFATPALLDSAPDRCVPLAAPDDPDALTLFFVQSSLVAIASSQFLLPRLAPAPSSGLVTSARGTVFASRFMPPYFKLPKLP